MAVKVTDWPEVNGFTEEANVVVVASPIPDAGKGDDWVDPATLLALSVIVTAAALRPREHGEERR